MAVALGSHAVGEVAATLFVGSGRDARGLSQTFSLPDQLGRAFVPGLFPLKAILWQVAIGKTCRRPLIRLRCCRQPRPPIAQSREGCRKPVTIQPSRCGSRAVRNARRVIEAWRLDYNEQRPHTSLRL